MFLFGCLASTFGELIRLKLKCRFNPTQGSRGSGGMVGIYCAFLNLDKRAMRRSENIAVLSVFPRQADLTEVTALITDQLRELASGITVLDFMNARELEAKDLKSSDAVPGVVDSKEGPGTKLLNVPFKKAYPRLACVLGDAVSQAVIAGCRATTSIYFCRCCFCNQGSVDVKTKVYDVRSDVLLHDFCK